MSRSFQVTRPYSTRLQGFVTEAYPAVLGRRAAGGGRGAEDLDPLLPSVAEAGKFSDYLRGLRQGRTQQPAPTKAWDLGGALSRLSQKRWVNPTTMLFACGHYGHVADLFLRLPHGAIPGPQVMEMARTLETVARSQDPTESRIADDIARRGAENWDAAMPSADRYDRRVWSIDARTYAAFLSAWHSQCKSGLISHHTVAASELLADRAEFDVDYREHVATLLLLDALRGTGV